MIEDHSQNDTSSINGPIDGLGRHGNHSAQGDLTIWCCIRVGFIIGVSGFRIELQRNGAGCRGWCAWQTIL